MLSPTQYSCRRSGGIVRSTGSHDSHSPFAGAGVWSGTLSGEIAIVTAASATSNSVAVRLERRPAETVSAQRSDDQP